MAYSQDFIDKRREINVNHEWWEYIYDDFKRICAILGIELDAHEPSFSGFWSQGDGASWAGTYRACGLGYAGLERLATYDTAPAKIRDHAPLDEELHAIADELCMLSRIYYPAYAKVIRSHYTRYVHENTMLVDYAEPYDDLDGLLERFADEVTNALEEGLLKQFRALARWLYNTLEAEYEYMTSDEAVVETLEANDIKEEETV